MALYIENIGEDILEKFGENSNLLLNELNKFIGEIQEDEEDINLFFIYDNVNDFFDKIRSNTDFLFNDLIEKEFIINNKKYIIGCTIG